MVGGILPSIENFAKGTAATMATLSTLSVGLIWFGQNYLIYPSAFPPGSREVVEKPSTFNLPYEDLELRTSDGVLLRCYMIPQKDPHGIIPDDQYAASKQTVMMFHGNGGNLGHRLPLALAFYRMHKCNVLMMCYRGYGLSEGTPSEKGLQIDAQTGLEYLLNHPIYSKTPIILYGQSLGGAVSIDLASRNTDKVRTPLTTLLPSYHPTPSTHTSIAKTDHSPHPRKHLHIPSQPRPTRHAPPQPRLLPLPPKMGLGLQISKIPATTPILMLSGRMDEIVPKEHMHALWEAVARRGQTVSSSPSSTTRNKEGEGEDSPSAPSPASGVNVDFKVGLERAKFVEFKKGAHNDTCAEPGYWTAIGDFLKSVREDFAPSSTTKSSREKHSDTDSSSSSSGSPRSSHL